MKKITSNKGFTLVELIIVIAILAIIMLIAIPNFSGIQQRMQVRADKSTAAQIGKAVRIWYTEYNSDPAFKAQVDAGKKLPTGKDVPMIDLETITNMEGYVDKTLVPTSLRTKDGKTDPNQRYYVGLAGSGNYEKVVVSIISTTKTDSTGAPVATTSVTLPEPNADGSSKLDSKSSPKYDGRFVTAAASDGGIEANFENSLAYMEP